jgi:hypothetical protein
MHEPSDACMNRQMHAWTVFGGSGCPHPEPPTVGGPGWGQQGIGLARSTRLHNAVLAWAAAHATQYTLLPGSKHVLVYVHYPGLPWPCARSRPCRSWTPARQPAWRRGTPAPPAVPSLWPCWGWSRGSALRASVWCAAGWSAATAQRRWMCYRAQAACRAAAPTLQQRVRTFRSGAWRGLAASTRVSAIR